MTYTKEELSLIILDSFEQLSYKIKYELLSGFNSFLPNWKICEQKLIKTLSSGVYNKVRELFESSNYINSLLKEYEKQKIFCVTYFSKNYPEELRNTPAPPIVLYCKGKVSLLNEKKFAVVGARRTPSNVLQTTKKISEELCSHFAVITGIADGADSAVLQGALAQGKAICVLAHGFNYVYPAGNGELLKRVIENGLVITEHIPKIAPRSYLFPVRNRIIAGLSLGTLVVSAGKKSGALITAGYAFDYGKEVFAFPYNIGASAGEGCNSLIKKGAYLTENILDIASVFGLDLIPRKQENISNEERALLNEIKRLGEAHISKLSSALNKPAYELFALLAGLEVKKLIARLGGNKFSATE